MSPRGRPKIPGVSETEWLLLSCVWELRAANPVEVAEQLRVRHGRDTSSKTVGILLGRLEEKGYLRSAPGPIPPRGRPALVYIPLISREDALRRQFEIFLETCRVQEEDIPLLEALLHQRGKLPAKG